MQAEKSLLINTNLNAPVKKVHKNSLTVQLHYNRRLLCASCGVVFEFSGEWDSDLCVFCFRQNAPQPKIKRKFERPKSRPAVVVGLLV